MDDILLLCFDSEIEGHNLKEILLLYNVGTGMEINMVKYTFYTFGLHDLQNSRMEMIFPLQHLELNNGVRYIGFNFKVKN